MSSMGIVLMPENLRLKLGEEAARELIDLINNSIKDAKSDAAKTAGEIVEKQTIESKNSLEKLIIQTKVDLEKQIIEAKADIQTRVAESGTRLLKWLFVFWVTQFIGMIGIVKMLK